MRVTGIREFRNKAPELASGDEIVFITKHGKLTGILVPLAEPSELPVELRQQLLGSLGPAISKHLDERGVSEEQVTRNFEPWKKRRRASRRR